MNKFQPNTFFLSSSVRTSLLTLAQGRSLGHHTGRHSTLPHPGLLRPVENFNISGMNARNCAYRNKWGYAYKTPNPQNNYLLFFIFSANITAYICPWKVTRPPNWSVFFLAPSGLSSAGWVFQHQRYECPQLCLKSIGPGQVNPCGGSYVKSYWAIVHTQLSIFFLLLYIWFRPAMKYV